MCMNKNSCYIAQEHEGGGKRGGGESKHFFLAFHPRRGGGKQKHFFPLPNTQGSREREHTSNIDNQSKEIKNERKSLNMTFFGILEGTILYPMLVLPSYKREIDRERERESSWLCDKHKKKRINSPT